MFKLGNIQVLCGARAGQAARETEQGGIFTRHLLAVLSEPHAPSLLALPFDLDTWHQALPTNLLEPDAVILNRREVMGEQANEAHRTSQEPSAPSERGQQASAA